MGETPQPQLNGAFYGPSIPPPVKSSHRPGRRSSGGGILGCCFGCLCSCLFNIIFQIVCTILVVAAVAVVIFWLIYRPSPVKFYVNDATLTQFDLSTTNNTVYYNLALNMTVRNPNKRIGIYYDNIEARALYEGERFATTNLETFYQGHKTTDYLSPVFKGQNILVLGSKDLSTYNKDKTAGSYDIDVKLYLKLRFKMGAFKPKFKPRIECDLKLPLESTGGTSGNFQTKKCDWDWKRWFLPTDWLPPGYMEFNFSIHHFVGSVVWFEYFILVTILVQIIHDLIDLITIITHS